MTEPAKARVTMTSHHAVTDPEDPAANEGVLTLTSTAVDYVPLDQLDAYVADARTRWDTVEIDDPREDHQ